MASEASPHIWDFKLAHDLSKAFRTSPLLTTEAIPTGLPSAPYDPKSSKSQSLGDMNRLYKYLGKQMNDIPLPKHHHISSESSSLSLSDHSTDPSSITEDVSHFDDFVGKAAKEVRWKDEVSGTDKIIKYRRNTNVSSSELDTAVIAQLLENDSGPNSENQPNELTQWDSSAATPLYDTNGFESELESRQRLPSHLNASADEFAFSPLKKSANALLPACLTPHRPKPADEDFLYSPPPIPKLYLDPTIIQPKFTLTAEEKILKLCKKLRKQFGDEPDSLLSTDTLHAITNWGGNVSDDGIHVFVDCSNIIIGFYNDLKISRNMSINARIKLPPFSYQSLALILERGRSVARRVLAGSNAPALYGIEAKKPQYFKDAERCGYELNLLDRVMKSKDRTPPRKVRGGKGNGYATSGQSSGSEAPYSRPKEMKEQAVDELLQMKLLESLVDTQKPTTIVLASGDAAEAEYSGGFLKNVERALQKGWKVELVAWSSGLSQEYRSREFLKRWKERFTVIELDDFSEELLGLYTSPYTKVSLGHALP